MKKKRFSVEKINTAIHQQELGTSVKDVCRKLGIAEGTTNLPDIRAGLHFFLTFSPLASQWQNRSLKPPILAGGNKDWKVPIRFNTVIKSNK